MKYSLFIFLFYLAILPATAQHTISGLITDQNDKSLLIAGVRVYIPEFGRTEISKEGGTYIFRNIGIGTVHIEFSKMGYKTVVRTVNSKDSATVIDVEMQISGERPEHIQESNGFNRLPSDLPYNSVSCDESEMRRSGMPDYVSSLDNLPGIDRFSSGSIVKPVIRGLAFNRVALVQEGIALDGFFTGETSDYDLIDETAGSVDIIKGSAASVLYGDNAYGGAVIFNDEKLAPAGTSSGHIALRLFSNTIGINVNAGIKGMSKDGFFFSFSGGNQSHTSYIQGNGSEIKKNTEQKDFAYNTGFHKANFRALIGLSKKWGQTSFAFDYKLNKHEVVESMSDSMIALIVKVYERDRDIFSPSVEQKLTILSSRTKVLIRNSLLNVTISSIINEFGTDYYPGPRNPLSEAYDYKKISGFSSDANFISNPGKHYGIIIGGQFKSINKTYYFTTKEDIKKLSGYGLFRYDLSKFNFLIGVRAEQSKIKETDPFSYGIENYQDDFFNRAFTAGVTWQGVKDLSVKLNSSAGYSVPVEFSRPVIYTINKNTRPSDLLSSEKNLEISGGISYDHEDFSVSVDGFTNRIRNYTVPSKFYFFSHTLDSLYIYQQGDAVISGGELSLILHPRAIKWIQLTCSYSKVKGKFEDFDLYLPYMPADKFSGELRFQSELMNYMYNPFIAVSTKYFMKHDDIFIDETPTDSYALFDLKMGSSFHWGQQTFDITLAVSNILNKGYFDPLSPLREMYPVGVREMGRNISLHLHVPFGISSKGTGS